MCVVGTPEGKLPSVVGNYCTYRVNVFRGSLLYPLNRILKHPVGWECLSLVELPSLITTLYTVQCSSTVVLYGNVLVLDR